MGRTFVQQNHFWNDRHAVTSRLAAKPTVEADGVKPPRFIVASPSISL